VLSWSRLTANWPLKLTSLLLAVLLWMVASFEEPSSRLVRVQLQLAVPAGRELLEAPAAAQALVVGSTRALLELDDHPLTLSKALPDSIVGGHAIVTLAPADIVLPRGVDVDVRDIQPREIVVALDSLDQRVVPIRAVPRGSAAALISLTPAEARISGPIGATRHIAFVRTVPFDLPPGDSADIRVALDTALGRAVRVTPAEVTVHLRTPAR
jgi:hypothetical protein